jgi:hypothetical protein
MRRTLTDLQVIEAYKLYTEQKLSTYQLADMFNCSAYVFQREFKKAELAIRDHSHAKQNYAINENIFDNIDTEEKAYWLGFLYADGNVSKTNRTRLSLAEEDIEIVEKFSNFIFGQERIKKYKQPENRKSFQDLVYVDVCNKHIAHTLARLGCPPKKTFILTFPDWLDKKLYNHFIRGYFDGDGCLSNYKEKQKGRGRNNKNIVVSEYDKSHFSILSTKEFLTSLQFLFSELNINSTITKRHKKRKNNNFTLIVSGNHQIQRLTDWLYKNSNIFLQRKYDKYLQLKSINDKEKS